MIRDQSI